MEKTVYIFGHRNPDTDSVTSAIALSFLKNKMGVKSKPAILADINKETEFVLDYFNISVPEFLNDVKLQLADIDYYKECFIDENLTIKEAYEYMKEKNITGVPLVDRNGKLKGLVTVKMIGNDLVDGDFIHLNTSYDNIVKTLLGKQILKFDNEIEGNIIAASFRSTTILNDISVDSSNILIVGDRHSVIEYAIQNDVKLLIMVGNHDIKPEHLQLAEKHKVNIIQTPYDTFHAAKLIGLSGYAKRLLSDERAAKVELGQYYDDFVALSSKQGYNNYPVVAKNGKCIGLLRVTDIKDKHRKKVILVDHNESSQSAVGLDEAEILEIVDHHKIGDLTTNKPINFRNMTVGSSNTIVYLMYKEMNIKIPKKIAGVMCGGIISDTLNLTSPTTTDIDKEALKELAEIAQIDTQSFATEMFKAGTVLDGKTKEEIINSDMKVFPINDGKIAISQIVSLNTEELLKEAEEYIDIMDVMCKDNNYDMMIFCITDIVKNGSYILCSTNCKNTMKEVLNVNVLDKDTFIPELISRKKQLVPMIMKYLQGE